MRQLLLFFLMFVNAENLFSQDALNIDLLDHWSQDSLLANSSQVRYNDCFGFVWKQKEYAIAGSTEGTHVFAISDENKFIPVGFIKGRFSNMSVIHRDYATFHHYLYAVCDEGVSSLQIIDLQYLPDSIHLVAEDSLQFGRVHNIFIDTIQEKLYSLIHRSTSNTQTIEAPMKIFSLANPIALTELYAGPSDVIEVHDAYVRNGVAILNCGFDGLRVYDFTNISSPLYLESQPVYQEQGYNHQGWLTPNGLTYIFADETNGKRIKKCQFDGTNISIERFFGTNFENGSVPHNIMASDTFAYVAYYNEGFRIFDLRYPTPLEVAHYDTYPDNTAFKLNGNWGVYSLLPSTRILASDRQYGLFLLDFDETLFRSSMIDEVPILYPSPIQSGENCIIRFPKGSKNISISIFDMLGRDISNHVLKETDVFEETLNLQSGKYVIHAIYQDVTNLNQIFTSPLIVY